MIMIIWFTITGEKNLIINLLINFAQFIIYEHYDKKFVEKTRDNITAKALSIDFK